MNQGEIGGFNTDDLMEGLDKAEKLLTPELIAAEKASGFYTHKDDPKGTEKLQAAVRGYMARSEM